MHRPTPDDTALEFIEHLYAGVETGWVSLFSLERRGATKGERHVDWADLADSDQVDQLVAVALDRTETCCVWIGAAPRAANLGTRRGGVDDCTVLPALWVDVDIAGPNHADNSRLPCREADAFGLVYAFPLPPTVIVRSGGGLQPWWFLNEPVEPKAGVELLDAWGATWAAIAEDRGMHLDSVFNLDRIMRLPGTTNNKHAPVEVTVVEATYGRRYSPRDLAEWFREPTQRVQEPVGRIVGYVGPERPGDAYNARHTGGDVLGQLGFAHDRTERNGDQHWVRPGKDAREGSSATVYGDDGHTTIWSDTCTAMWPTLKVRRPYDPFGLLVATRYRDDFTKASAELLAGGYGQPPRHVEPADLIASSQVSEHASDLGDFLDPDIDEFLSGEEPPYDWVIPNIVEGGDRVIITGEEGKGKSTLLRQIAVQCASGLHPFTGAHMDHVAVLVIDCENSRRQSRRKLRPLRELVDDAIKPELLRINIVGHALDLARPEILNAISLRVQAHQPRLIIIGPLYKMTDGDPTKEEPAKGLADALDHLRGLCGSALLIEAHTPYADGSKSRRPIRPYGASLWSRWPEFGIFLGADGALEHWRGARDERNWPRSLERSAPWPWAVAAEGGSDAPAWDGPTECMLAIEHFLALHPDDEFAKSGLPPKLRAAGNSWRDRTVYEALEMLVARGRIRYRRGPRSAELYRSIHAPDAASSLEDLGDF